MFDVAIVGGGPAGAWCAIRLAARGLRVAILDGSHPREKPCGGGVTGRALSLVGESRLALTSAVAIRTATFTLGSRRVDVGLPAAPLRLAVVARREFDARLLERAAAGATVIGARAVDLRRVGHAWHVLTAEGEISAHWLIGADGANSMVRKRVSRAFPRQDISIACGYYVHGIVSERIDIVFENDPAGYLWSFPRRDHLAVGVCAQADVASTATLMPIVDRWIKRYANGGRRERYSWPIPSLTAQALDREVPAGEGWMLIGDAAGVVDPITREGIFFAMRSAEIAAESLGAQGCAPTTYATRVQDEIYGELRRAARLKARFYRPAFLSLLMTSLQRSAAIRDVMADLVAGEQPYRTLRRRLLKTMEFRLMLDLLCARRV
ncbi:MAG: NAD(P)/FAD-dependent oxidoreductase [Vicinamibacterales bacterium]